MAAVDDVDQLIEQFHLASGEFLKGNPEPAKKLFSHREDVTLNNPYGPPAHGWEHVAKTAELAASQVRDGEFVSAEIIEKNVTPELAYVVEIERAKKLRDALQLEPTVGNETLL
jgi:dihydroorotate dehydrogenase